MVPKHFNRPFPSCFQPHRKNEAKCKVFIMKISFHFYANKTNFRMKSFALKIGFTTNEVHSNSEMGYSTFHI